MEGAGQLLGVLWLTHPEGGNVPVDIAIKGFRRKRNQWSQDEGLGLFLALIKIAPPNWSGEMFSDHPTHIVDLLKKAVK